MSSVPNKICRKCKQVFPATDEYFYKHPNSKYGVTPRCKSCVNEDNKESLSKRMLVSAESIRRKNCEKAKRHYMKNLEESRAYQRRKSAEARADPEKRAKIYARKRGGHAGLSPKDIEDILKSQDYKCAICYTEEPNKSKGSKGWNLDHCHKTKRIRFILCNHCNRGLGAFKDDPEIMRRAADAIEEFNKSEKESIFKITIYPENDGEEN